MDGLLRGAPLNPRVIRVIDVASPNNKRLQQALAGALKARGFRKDGATWRKRYAEAIGVINLQGSQWGPSFYLNLGVYFTAMGSTEKPPESHCHIRARLDGFVRDPRRLRELLDFEKPVPDHVRASELEAAMLESGVPWLERVSTPQGARELCVWTNWPVVTGDARKYLGLVPSV